MRLIEKEQTQKIKDDAETIIYSGDCNIAPEFKIKYNKQTNDDTLKPIAIYGVAANGDIFNETSNHLNNDVAIINTNNNTSFLSPRKRKTNTNTNTKSKQKKTKAQDNMHDNLSVLQLPSTIGSIQNSVTSLPDDINKMLPKQEKSDGISVSVSDEQYQIYLIET